MIAAVAESPCMPQKRVQTNTSEEVQAQKCAHLVKNTEEAQDVAEQDALVGRIVTFASQTDCLPVVTTAQISLTNSMVLTSGEVMGLSQDRMSKQDTVAGKHKKQFV